MILQLSPTAEFCPGQYLRGPHGPAHVKKHGYGFTADPKQAWPFKSKAEAMVKAVVVARHMGWDAGVFEVVA